MDLKCFYELDCPQLEEIQQQTLTYLTGLYKLDDQESLGTDLWLKIDYKSLLKSCPALLEWARSLKLYIREVAITVVNDYSGASLHIDEFPVTAKINIPILNYQLAVNEWYNIPEHVKNQYKPTVNQFGKEFWSFKNIDLSQCELIDSITLTKPIVFNSRVPHCVKILPGCQFPRVVMPVMFINEPVDYLKL